MLKKGKQEIIKVGSILYKRGLISGFDGNISQVFENDKIIITVSGVHKGFLRHRDLIVIDKKGKIIDGVGKPSSETKMHLEIYKTCPNAHAVIHVHGPYAVAASLENEKEIDVSDLVEGKILFNGKIEMVPSFKPGSEELAKEAGKIATKQNTFILKAHGAVSWGKDLFEAFSLLEALENNLKILALRKLFRKEILNRAPS